MLICGFWLCIGHEQAGAASLIFQALVLAMAVVVYLSNPIGQQASLILFLFLTVSFSVHAESFIFLTRSFSVYPAILKFLNYVFQFTQERKTLYVIVTYSSL